MYEQLEAHAGEFNDLQKTLADPAGAPTVDAIRQSLEATAQRISETQGATDLDRNNLAKLYRGFLAASRVIARLQEKQAGARA
ncbi:type III secretion protein [Paraburkholderia dilworthii]|uniref:Type III secretion protein n=1 Tax=Paraburkholderia dilworthii TaxID=948106 RepID=A0ABW9D879_9BURK